MVGFKKGTSVKIFLQDDELGHPFRKASEKPGLVNIQKAIERGHRKFVDLPS